MLVKKKVLKNAHCHFKGQLTSAYSVCVADVWGGGEEGRGTRPCKRPSEVRLRLASVFKVYAHKRKLPASGTTGDGRVVSNPSLIQQHRVLS